MHLVFEVSGLWSVRAMVIPWRHIFFFLSRSLNNGDIFSEGPAKSQWLFLLWLFVSLWTNPLFSIPALIFFFWWGDWSFIHTDSTLFLPKHVPEKFPNVFLHGGQGVLTHCCAFGVKIPTKQQLQNITSGLHDQQIQGTKFKILRECVVSNYY